MIRLRRSKRCHRCRQAATGSAYGYDLCALCLGWLDCVTQAITGKLDAIGERRTALVQAIDEAVGP